MNYHSEEEYNQAMGAAMEAEAQQEEDYQIYLQELSETNPYLYGLEVCIDLLQSKNFTKSDLSAVEYLSKIKNSYMKEKLSPKEPDTDELAF